MKWLNKVLKHDDSDSTIHAIVVGIHKALPNSLGNWHSMSETTQGIYSGRCVYKSLAKAQTIAQKHVYVLASHSHFYENPPQNSKTDVYGYILATVNAGGKPSVIQFEFKEIPNREDIPAEVRKLFSSDLVDFCFDQNKELTPAGTFPEPPDGPCPEPE